LPTKYTKSVTSHASCEPDFKKFLDLAERATGVLPKWWSAEKRHECEAFSKRTMMGEYKYHGHAEGNIFSFTEKSDIQEHYEAALMPMMLRMLAEKVYGSGVV
jgi:splicing suppressor protein 51